MTFELLISISLHTRSHWSN